MKLKLLFFLLFIPSLAMAQERPTGLVWSDGIEPGDPSKCEAPVGKTCYWVNCDAVADGTGTYASPFWGFETVFGYYSSGSYQLGSAVGGDVVYVKGTCGVTGSVDNVNGPYKQIRIAREAQLGTQAAPLIIKSWKGTARATFDGEFTTTLSGQNDSNNAPTTLIHVKPVSVTSGKAIKIQNIKIYRAISSGIRCSMEDGTVQYCTINSVEFRDNFISTEGTSSPLSLGVFATDYTQLHVVSHSLFADNYRNCDADGAGSGDATCTAGDNDGSFAIYSANASTGSGTVKIFQNYFNNNTKHIRDKHNGSNTTEISYNYFGSSEGEAIHDRQTTKLIHHNVFNNSTPRIAIVVTDDAPPGGQSRSLSFYNNTLYNVDALFQTSSGAGTYTDYLTWSVYNNILYSTTTNSVNIIVGQYAGTTFTPAKWTSDHNYFYVNSTVQAAFSCLAPASSGGACTSRSFANTKTYLSDTTSSVTDPLFVDAATTNFTLRSTSPAKTAGRNGGYIGAYQPYMEICGNGLMDSPLECKAANSNSDCAIGSCPAGWMDSVIGSGCDLKCPAPDQDNDGYMQGDPASFSDRENMDCDDTDRAIFPGIYTTKGCTGGQYHKCQQDGSYSACTASTLCEATGSGRCWYIDPTSGNDTTGTGTSGSPFKSFKPVAYWYTGQPSNHYSLTPGDVIYLVGSGTLSDYYDVGGGYGQFVFMGRSTNFAGTSKNPITITRYPGSTVVINPNSDASNPVGGIVFRDDAKNWIVKNVEVTGTYDYGIVSTYNSHNVEIYNAYVHDIDGNCGANNVAGIGANTGSSNTRIHHVYVRDIYNKKLTAPNPNCVDVYISQGYDNSVKHSVMWSTDHPNDYSNTRTMCFKYKHSDSTKQGNFDFINNTVWNCLESAGEIATPEATIRGNRVYESSSGFACADWGGTNHCNHYRVEYNYFQNTPTVGSQFGAGMFAIGSSAYDSGLGPNYVARNVFVDMNNTVYNSGSPRNIVSIQHYGSNTKYNAMVDGYWWSIGRNCYYNPNISALTNGFSFYGDNGSGNLGAEYDGSGWITAFDKLSFVENPSTNSYNQATSSNCSDKGWRAQDVAPGIDTNFDGIITNVMPNWVGDRDHDGYPQGQDCDDTSWNIIPGYYYSCDAGSSQSMGYRKCNSDGSWTSCVSSATTPLCEKTGSGHCYYIDFQDGSDSTGSGTYASPWKTFAMVNSYYSSSPPSGHVNLVAGDVVYLMGWSPYYYDYTHTINAYGEILFFLLNITGTSANPITIKRYPGSKAIVRAPWTEATVPAHGFMFTENSPYVTFDGLEVSGGYGTVFQHSGSNYAGVTRNYIHDVPGNCQNNVSGFSYGQTSYAQIHHNRIHNMATHDYWTKCTQSHENVRAGVLFNDNVGGAHNVSWNRFSGVDVGWYMMNGLSFKHGASGWGTAGLGTVYGNIMWHLKNVCINGATSKLDVKYNLCINSVLEWGPNYPTYLNNVNTEYNTVVYDSTLGPGDERLRNGVTGFGTVDEDISRYMWGPITFKNNIIWHKITGQTIERTGGFVVWNYGSDWYYDWMLGGKRYTTANNCYWNPSETIMFNYFGQNGDKGGFYTLGQIQSLGIDTGSTVTDPVFNSQYLPTAAGCLNKGWKPITSGTQPRSASFGIGR